MTDTDKTPEGLAPDSLVLDAPGLGIEVTDGDVNDYLDLARRGMFTADAGNCGAVQDDFALRRRTTPRLDRTDTS